MVQTAAAKVAWNSEKKHWEVVIQAGAEVIRRQCADTPREAGPEQLRQLAIQTAKDEGYNLDAAQVSIVQ